MTEDPEEFLEDAMDDILTQSEVDSDVYYFEPDEYEGDLDGLSKLFALGIDEIEEKDEDLAGLSLCDLMDASPPIRLEILVADEYGEVKDRRWIDGMETDLGHEFKGGAYHVEDQKYADPDEEGPESYVLVGATYVDGTSLGQSWANHPVENYEDLDEFVEEAV